MPLQDFKNTLWKAEHRGYKDSILGTVAPEYTTGEVILAASYRKLLLGISEKSVDLTHIDEIPAQSNNEHAWTELILWGGLGSPVLSGRHGKNFLKQLMPVVPSIARCAGVLGRVRNRWDPGNLLISAVQTGLGVDKGRDLLVELGVALKVDSSDDLLARYIDSKLEEIHGAPYVPPTDFKVKTPPAYRGSPDYLRVPAERFCDDLRNSLLLKPHLTRRQWTVLIEACLRVGLAMHILWLCKLNHEVWRAILEAIKDEIGDNATSRAKTCWPQEPEEQVILELGINAVPSIKGQIRGFIEARIGINLILHALEDGGAPWNVGIGKLPDDAGEAAPEAIGKFLSHVSSNAEVIKNSISKIFKVDDPNHALAKITDTQPKLLSCGSGITKNMLEFIRYGLGQLQPANEELKGYDQAYLLFKKHRKQAGSPWLVQPGPACLIFFVHSACSRQENIPVSIEDLKSYLLDYGILAPTGELSKGKTGSDLQQLGLVVDSPDAGGGRLLVAPFKGVLDTGDRLQDHV